MIPSPGTIVHQPQRTLLTFPPEHHEAVTNPVVVPDGRSRGEDNVASTVDQLLQLLRPAHRSSQPSTASAGSLSTFEQRIHGVAREVIPSIDTAGLGDAGSVSFSRNMEAQLPLIQSRPQDHAISSTSFPSALNQRDLYTLATQLLSIIDGVYSMEDERPIVEDSHPHQCPLCLCCIRDPVVVEQCGHRFDRDCLQTWCNEQEGAGTCPMCRVKITYLTTGFDHGQYLSSQLLVHEPTSQQSRLINLNAALERSKDFANAVAAIRLSTIRYEENIQRRVDALSTLLEPTGLRASPIRTSRDPVIFG